MNELINLGFIEIDSQPIVELISPQFVTDRLDVDYYRPEYLRLDDQMQNLGFQQKRMADLSKIINDGPGGWSLQSSEYVTEGIPLIRIVDFRSNLDPAGMVYISPAKHEELLRYEVLPGDVLITAAGSIGEAQVLPQSITKANFRDLIRIRLKPGTDPYYLSAYLNSKYGRMITRRFAHGAVQLHLKVYDSKEITVVVPNPQIQAYIGDKVRLAEKCREEANQCASRSTRILFDALDWPIDFLDQQSHFVAVEIICGRLDPKYYQDNYLHTLQHIQSYADGFILLGELVESVSNGYEYREYTNDGVPYLTVSDISRGRLVWKQAPRIPSSAPISARGKLNFNDVLVVRTGSIGQSSFVHRSCSNAVISSHFIRLRLKSPMQAPWIAFLLNCPIGEILLERIAYGAIQPQIGQEELLQLPIPIIDQTLQNTLAKLWTKYILLNEISEDLIVEAKKDVESLIDGKSDIHSIPTSNHQVVSWETIERNLQKELADYA